MRIRLNLAGLTLAFLAGFAVFPGEAHCGPVTIDAVKRMPMVVAEGCWNFRLCRLANRSEVDRSVLLVYQTSGVGYAGARFSVPADLKANSSIELALPVRPLGLMSIKSGISDLDIVEESYDLLDGRTGQQLHRLTLSTSRVEEKSVISFCIESSDDESFSYLTKSQETGLGTDFYPGHVAGRDLPEKSFEYDSVGLLVMGGVDVSLLRPAQVEALMNYVRAGGTLVLSGGTTMQSMLTGQIAQAAGVAILGMHSLSQIDVPALKLPTPVRLAKPMPMAQLCVQDAAVISETGGLPLLTHKRMGRGHIFVLALPIGGLEDQALHGLWKPVSLAMRTMPAVRNDSTFLSKAAGGSTFKMPASAMTASDVLHELAGRKAPPRAVPVFMLAGLGLAVVVAGAVLRRGRRGERLWIALVPLSLAMAAGMYLHGAISARPQTLSYVGLVTDMGDGKAMVQQAMAYYSGREDRNFNLSAGSDEGTISPIHKAGSTSTLNTLNIRHAQQMLLPDQSLPSNSSCMFSMQSVVQTPGLRANLTFDESGLRCRLTNDLTTDLTDAVLYANRQAYRIGDVAAGQAVEVLLDEARRLGKDEFTCANVKDELRNGLLTQLVGRGRNIDSEPVVIGYSKLCPLMPLAQDVPRQGWSVLVWPANIAQPAPGKRLRVPSGLVKWSFVSAAVYDPFREEYLPSHMPAEVLVSIKLPAGVRLGDMSADLKIVIRAGQYRMSVGGVPGGDAEASGRVEVKTFDNPSGVFKVSVPQADRFIGADGNVLLYLKLSASALPASDGGAAGFLPGMGDGPSAWKLEGLDVSVEGISR